MRMATEALPDFDKPPVIEIVGAMQFVALPRLNLADIVNVGQHLAGYQLHELQPELPPMAELAPGAPEQQQFTLGLGQPPQRALFVSPDQRFVAQLQRDRVAVNERRRQPSDADPSANTVWPELAKLVDCVNAALGAGPGFGPSSPTVVEVTYVNWIAAAEGVWTTHAELHKVLRVFGPSAGEAPFDQAEQLAARFSFPLIASDTTFRGRLHVVVEPGYDQEGNPMFHLNLFSRRLVTDPARQDLSSVFEDCHQDVVRGFTAITTPMMHEVWERRR